MLSCYQDNHLKFFYANFTTGFWSVTYRSTYPCSFPHCGEPTYIAPYCDFHRLHLNLEIKVSNLPGAGRGLFATKKLPSDPRLIFGKGDYVALYGEFNHSGYRLSTPREREDACRYLEGVYGVQNPLQIYAYADLNMIYDCARLRYLGAYANDADYPPNPDHPHPFENNVRFVLSEDRKLCYLRALTDIYDQQEIFVDYGPSYWERYPDEYIRFEDNTTLPAWFEEILQSEEKQIEILANQFEELSCKPFPQITLQSFYSMENAFQYLTV